MKITHRLIAPGEKPDELKLNGNIFTINGKDYDLDNLDPRIELIPVDNFDPQEPKYKNQSEYDAQRVWLDESGEINALIVYGVERQFMFINGNLLKFHDLNDNGIIDRGAELKKLVAAWNMTTEERRAYYTERLKNS